MVAIALLGRARWIYRGLAGMLLAAIAVQNFWVLHRSPNIQRYQSDIRASADRVPGHIGAWVGTPVAVPAQALTVLQPNLLISNRYLNVETGKSAGVFLVHCADAHHMVGHFPLRCYKAVGWKVVSAVARDWPIDGLVLTGTEYHFSMDVPGGQPRTLIVANCLLRPGGKILRDMDSLSRSFSGEFGSSSGAGQIQVYFDASIPEAQRDSLVVTFARGYRPVLDAILADPDKASGMGVPPMPK